MLHKPRKAEPLHVTGNVAANGRCLTITDIISLKKEGTYDSK